MEPMHSANPALLSRKHQALLLDIAEKSIRSRLEGSRGGYPLPSELPAELEVVRASFVTLEKDGELRGCIGTLTARIPLAEDVARNARLAAFEDPRFSPVTEEELQQLEVHLSILSPLEPMRFTSEPDLLAQLRPGIDGLVLESGHNRGTFLPAVWEQCPTPAHFLRELKRKAGLPWEYWSDSISVSRYTVEYFGRKWAGRPAGDLPGTTCP